MFQYKLSCAATRGRIIVLSTVLPMLALAVFAQSAGAASDETVGDMFPVSVTPRSVYANGEGTVFYGPVSISDDGRYVAFESSATKLGGEGPSGVTEAFVKDLHTGEVQLVSRANGASGEPADSPGVENMKISGDGRYVIFSSKATNLLTGLPDEEPEEQHVYRRDLRTGETALVDRATGTQGAILSRGAVAEAISSDGRYVVFAAEVSDLENPAGAHAKSGIETVYVRDMHTGTTTAVSRAGGPAGEIANQESQAYSISPDGRYVPFASRATNLVPGTQSNIYQQVYLRDLETGTTTLVSQIANGEAGEGRSENPVLVGESGCEVEFNSEVYNLLEPPSIEIGGELIEISGPQVYLRDLCSTPASTTLLSQDETGIAGDAYGVFGGSADASEILFAGEFLSGYHLFLRDPGTEQTMQLDRASGAEGESANKEAEQAAISTNGCRAVFDTQATNLLGQGGPQEGPNGEKPTEVYVRQLAACNEEPAVTPTGLSFPVQALDTIGSGQIVTVTAGSEALQIHNVQPTGADSADFIVTADECSGETLRPAGKCTLLVRFAPTAAGPRSASLIVRAANATGLEVPLSGTGGELPSDEKGAQGDPGGLGPQGSPGQQGVSGPQGVATQGAKGQTGVRGAKGEKGQQRGSAGRDVKVVCRPAKNRGKLICSVRSVAAVKCARPLRAGRRRARRSRRRDVCRARRAG
ncbi:MAG TPA: hypothetical protein VIJ39_13390 [Solirubrobacteraceae bacterium]